MALNQFALDPEGFDANIARQVKSGLQNALKAKPITVNPVSQSVLDTVKPGDDLPKKTRTMLRDNVQDFYLLIGRISKREDKTIVTAAVYDLRTGKVVAEAQVSKDNLKPPPALTKVTLTFKPDSNLRVKSFQWIVNGERKGETPLGRMNSLDVDIPQDAKTIKIGLAWSGSGYRNKTTFDYKDITVDDFEVDIQKDKSVELSARVNTPKFVLPGQDIRGNLEITVRANGRALHPKWH